VCGLELPDLQQHIHVPFADQGVRVVGLYTSESPDLLMDFQEQTGVTIPLVEDAARTLGLFAFPAGVGYPYPRDIVVGKDLTIHSIKNSFDADEMRALVEQLLAE